MEQIGKTSSLVLTLSGVLKDILLVVASVVIWHSPLTILQIFGYSIAVGGLVLYKLGANKLKEAVAGFQIVRSRRRYRATQKAITACIGLFLVILTLERIYAQKFTQGFQSHRKRAISAGVFELYGMGATTVS